MNKVLIFGAGPSFYKSLYKIKDFDGKIIMVDAIANHLIPEGYIPDYITTFEKKEGIELKFFPASLAKHDIEVIHNFDTLSTLTNHLAKIGVKYREFKSYRWERINNVGLFSCRFAREILKADELHLAGFDHTGTEYTADVFKSWMNNFEYFLEDEKNKCKIINYSDGNLHTLEGVVDGRK